MPACSILCLLPLLVTFIIFVLVRLSLFMVVRRLIHSLFVYKLQYLDRFLCAIDLLLAADEHPNVVRYFMAERVRTNLAQFNLPFYLRTFHCAS